MRTMRRILAWLLFGVVAVGCGGASGGSAEDEAADAATSAPAAASESVSPYRRAAVDAATWIRSTAISGEHGTAWPADPHDTAAVVTNLYTGTPGVVLFFLELAEATGESGYLRDARAGADFLVARLEGEALQGGGEGGEPIPDATVQGAGLYTGLAGIGFVLHETYRATGEEVYRDAAMRAVERIHEQARETAGGVAWEDSTDIISGGAGTGLFLLYAAEQMGHEPSRRLAERAGDHLIDVAEQHAAGLGWRVYPDYPRLMPNFSHGTAGVAYFLAALHQATGEQDYLDAAIAGAERLLSLAETEGDVCLVFHHTDGGEELQYLSWCHGPAGTARTFYKLWEITGEPQWMEWTERSANGVYRSGIPETLTEGFWNNVGQCCGSAGVIEFALALHGAGVGLPDGSGAGVGVPDGSGEGVGVASGSGEDPDFSHLNFAVRAADNLLGRATEDGGGLMWVQAEHRVQPDFLVAQTGYMQGAAGIGMMLLHLDAVLEGAESPRIRFPDTPY